MIPLSQICSDHWGSLNLTAGSPQPTGERFPTRSSHSDRGQKYIGPSNAVRSSTYCWLVVGPIQDGLPTSKAPLSVVTIAPMRSRFPRQHDEAPIRCKPQRGHLQEYSHARCGTRLYRVCVEGETGEHQYHQGDPLGSAQTSNACANPLARRMDYPAII